MPTMAFRLIRQDYCPMKKIFLLGAMECALGMMTACKSANNTEVEKGTTCSTDTIHLADTAFVEQTVEVTQNGIVWEDVRISQAEFEAAALVKTHYQKTRSDRTPDKKDSAIVRNWTKEIGEADVDYCMKECGFYDFEGCGHIVELAAGDYCCTRTQNDTTRIETCWLSLSTDNLLASYYTDVIYWDAPFEDAEGIVYIYPYDCTTDKLGKPFVYKTPPRWWPCGDSFWGADGWFFIQGWDKERNTEYHKVRPKQRRGIEGM